MANQTIKRGDIVSNSTSLYLRDVEGGERGVVTRVKREKDGECEVEVAFPTARERYYFDPSDLEIHPEFLPLDAIQEAYRSVSRHGNNVHTISSLKAQLRPGLTLCMHPRCNKLAFFSAWINIWGSAYNTYVCGEHADFHGNWADDLNFKPKSKPNRKGTELKTEMEIAHFLFGDMPYEPQKFPLMYGGILCQFEKCKKRAFFSIVTSSAGKARGHFVCGEHAAHHGEMCDKLTNRWQVTAAIPKTT